MQQSPPLLHEKEGGKKINGAIKSFHNSTTLFLFLFLLRLLLVEEAQEQMFAHHHSTILQAEPTLLARAKACIGLFDVDQLCYLNDYP